MGNQLNSRRQSFGRPLDAILDSLIKSVNYHGSVLSKVPGTGAGAGTSTSTSTSTSTGTPTGSPVPSASGTATTTQTIAAGSLIQLQSDGTAILADGPSGIPASAVCVAILGPGLISWSMLAVVNLPLSGGHAGFMRLYLGAAGTVQITTPSAGIVQYVGSVTGAIKNAKYPCFLFPSLGVVE